MMGEYLLRLALLIPLVGAMAWGSLWLWKRFQPGMGLGGGKAPRSILLAEVLPLGPGMRLAVVEFAGQRLLLAISRAGVTRIADDAAGDFHHD
jgi:flagellar protein FliO/FliZ